MNISLNMKKNSYTYFAYYDMIKMRNEVQLNNTKNFQLIEKWRKLKIKKLKSVGTQDPADYPVNVKNFRSSKFIGL